jgi:serine O-acetyltransferase
VEQERPIPAGLKGDIIHLFSARGTHDGRPTPLQAFERIVTRPGPLALAFHRVSHTLWRRGLHVTAEVIWRISYLVTGADIHPAAEIGGGLRIAHTSGVVIGKGARVGSDVTILPGVVVGGAEIRQSDGSRVYGFPEIGDGTELSTGAKVLGPIHIGRHCRVGANVVLSRDVDDNTVLTEGQERRALTDRIEELENRIAALEARASKDLPGRDE